MHIHLDFVGGMAGDMFCAAMLDAFPELYQPLQDFLTGLPLFAGYRIETKTAKQKEIVGKRFLVIKDNAVIDDKNHMVFTPLDAAAISPVPLANMNHDHHHYSWVEIERKIDHVTDSLIRQRVSEIYRLLVQAESEVHGVTLDKIHLHEVGADDALIDIISAAYLITYSGVTSWSCSALPWGNGTIKCAHGQLPVPAPASVKLLKNFTWRHDDEIGERVTPTGAAILAWLMSHASGHLRGELVKDGYGCGKRQFNSLANIIRVCVFSNPTASVDDGSKRPGQDQVDVIQFDIDDMTPEFIAIAQDRLRLLPGVIDLASYAMSGKKGRFMVRNELLAQPGQREAILAQIFLQTSTLGVRYWSASRKILDRQQIDVDYQNTSWPVKIAHRPDDSVSAKLEAAAIGALNANYAQSNAIKSQIEHLATARPPVTGDK